MRSPFVALALVVVGLAASSARADDSDEDPYLETGDLGPLPELAALSSLPDLGAAGALSELPPLPGLTALGSPSRLGSPAPKPASPATPAAAPHDHANPYDADKDDDRDESMVSFPAETVALGQSDQFSRHIEAFTIDARAVSPNEYSRCVAAGKCTKPSCASSSSQDRVTCVDLGQAKAYCTFAGKRLPSEDEWERAGRTRVRGMDDGAFEWTASPYCFFCDRDDQVVRGGPAHDAKLRGWRKPATSEDDLGFRCAR
jgi:formylglycine-generating enzyme required for sulfatase activity